MATVAATVSKPTLRALLGAPPARPHYRRSTTTKAPRKRTFVNLQMEKYNPGVRSEGTGSVLCKATAGGASELLQACTGGNDNSTRGGNGGSSQPPRGNGGNGGDSSGQPQPVPRALVMGAATLLAALVLLPSQQAAASGPGLRTLRVAGASSPAAAPRSLCLNHSSSNIDAAAATEGAILYGSVVLSEAERRLMARSSRQLFFSECVRVGAGGSSAVAART